VTEKPALRGSALELLLRVTAHPRAVVDNAQITEGNDGQMLVDHKLLSSFTNQTESIEIDGEDRELIWDSSSRTYRYFSPSAGWVDVPEILSKSYRVDFNVLLAMMRQWLGMDSHVMPRVLEPELLWDLGETWISRRRVAVLFLRRVRLPETITKARAALLSFPRRGSSLILTDGRPSEYGPDLPGNPVLVSLLDIFPPDMDVLDGVDADSLASLIGAASETSREWTPVECSEDGSRLRIHDQRYHFSGLTHKRIIQLLYEAWERGDSRLRTSYVLSEAESRSRTISQAFSGCKEDWKAAIGYGDGDCWLKVEDNQ
jgi:hypothetical protein